MTTPWERIEPRTRRAMRNAGIETLDVGLAMPDEELLRLPSFGRKALHEIHLIRLEQYGHIDHVRPPPPALVATSPRHVLGLVSFEGRLIVATDQGVFERRDDGAFHEIRFITADQEKPVAD